MHYMNFLEVDKIDRKIESGEIEIAPLAFGERKDA